MCEKFAAKGCNIAINYFSNADAATKLAKKIEKEHHVKTFVIQGDAGVYKDCHYMVRDTIAEFDGLDILIGNAVREVAIFIQLPPAEYLIQDADGDTLGIHKVLNLWRSGCPIK